MVDAMDGLHASLIEMSVDAISDRTLTQVACDRLRQEDAAGWTPYKKVHTPYHHLSSHCSGTMNEKPTIVLPLEFLSPPPTDSLDGVSKRSMWTRAVPASLHPDLHFTVAHILEIASEAQPHSDPTISTSGYRSPSSRVEAAAVQDPQSIQVVNFATTRFGNDTESRYLCRIVNGHLKWPHRVAEAGESLLGVSDTHLSEMLDNPMVPEHGTQMLKLPGNRVTCVVHSFEGDSEDLEDLRSVIGGMRWVCDRDIREGTTDGIHTTEEVTKLRYMVESLCRIGSAA